MPTATWLGKVVSTGPAVLFALRLDGRTPKPLWIGPNLARLTGYSPSEWSSLSRGEAIHPDDLPAVAAAFERLFERDVAESRHRFRHKDGSWIWLHQELHLERDVHGEPQYVLGAILNVTERERAKLALVDREARYRALAEATSDAIVVLEDGIVREVNGSFSEQYGYELEDVIGRSALHFVSPEHRGLAAASIAKETEGAYELRLLTKDGSERVVAIAARMHRSDGRTLRLLALRDLTSTRELEEQFHQAQKMEAVGRLASNVAHDFNNILTVINGCIELAGMSLPPDHAALADLMTAIGAVKQGTELSRQLMDVSRPSAAESAFCEVNTIMVSDEPLFRRLLTASNACTLTLDPATPSVAMAPAQLRQCMVNLVINARDAMPNGGTLAIETSAVDLDGEAASLPAGRYARIVVKDTGVGMTSAVRMRIFEPFFTTKANRGTGLGLASVWGLVSRAGGHVTVWSEPQRGTRFEILLPAA